MERPPFLIKYSSIKNMEGICSCEVELGVEVRILHRQEDAAFSSGNYSKLTRLVKAVGTKELAVIAITILLALLSSWGYYLKSAEVSKAYSRLDLADAHNINQANALSELNSLLADLQLEMALNEELFNEMTSALRQEIDTLKGRLPLSGLVGPASGGKAPTGKIAYLTFDDGPLTATADILNVLKEYDVKATFFVNGRDSNYSLRMYKRMVAEGHAIGNHTYSHEYEKVYSSVSGFVAEVEQLQRLVYETTGITPEIMRFPAGSDNRVSFSYSGQDLMPSLTRVVQAMGMQYFDWNVTSGSASAASTADSVYNYVIEGCQGRSVVNILFHETRVVAEALPLIIEELRLQGYSFAVLTKTSPAMQFLR